MAKSKTTAICLKPPQTKATTMSLIADIIYKKVIDLAKQLCEI